MKKLSLNGIWNMTGNGYAVNGTIPGSIYSFLYLGHILAFFGKMRYTFCILFFKDVLCYENEKKETQRRET